MKQKKDIKRQKERLAGLEKQAAEEREQAKERARQRVLEDFEKGQLGLGGAGVASSSSSSKTDDNSERGYHCADVFASKASHRN